MRRALSISLGSSSRDKTVRLRLLGEEVELERRGTDGDEALARSLYRELDGKVDAFGVGGVELSLRLPWKEYPLRSGRRLVGEVRSTPCVDGQGLKKVLEGRVMEAIGSRVLPEVAGRRAFVVEGASRWGMSAALVGAGFDCVFGDLMFALGLPIPLKGIVSLERAARLLLPLVSLMPISMLYSTGEAQTRNEPKYERWFREADLVAGDWLYIRRHAPADLRGKVIVTNTTTEADVDFMRERGVRWLVTTTPVYEGRSFGTNALEAALVAAAGKGRALDEAELVAAVDQAGIGPSIRELS